MTDTPTPEQRASDYADVCQQYAAAHGETPHQRLLLTQGYLAGLNAAGSKVFELERDLSECRAVLTQLEFTSNEALLFVTAESNDLRAALAKQQAAIDELVAALEAGRVMWRSQKPAKLDEALSWRENDLKAEAMGDAALSAARAILPPQSPDGAGDGHAN